MFNFCKNFLKKTINYNKNLNMKTRKLLKFGHQNQYFYAESKKKKKKKKKYKIRQ